jgi:hypothetical protein
MKANHWWTKLAAILLAASAYPAGVALADDGVSEDPGVVDEAPLEDGGEVVDVGVVADGETMPEDWIYMTGAPVEGEEAPAGDAVVLELEDGTVVLVEETVDGEVDITAEPLMYTTGVAGESSSLSVNAPDYVDASGISEVQLDPAFDGNSVVETGFDRGDGELSAPEVPAPSEGGSVRLEGGKLVQAAPASN